jgi:4-hydroxyphenylpyruvate dioxygenase
MKKSIATVSLGGKLTDKLEAIAAAGFESIEIFEPNLLSYEGTPREIARYTAELGLTVELFQPFRDFEGVSDDRHRQNLDRAQSKFDLMDELGAALMLVCSNTNKDVFGDEERSAAQLYELAECARCRGKRIGYEALAWGTHVNRFDKAWGIVQRANHANLGLIVDSFHTLVLTNDWSSLSDLPGERIFFVQLGDAPRLSVDPLTLRRHHSKLPGEGDFDVPSFLRAVLATGYSGTISLEIFNEKTPLSPRETASAGLNSLVLMEKLARS